MDDQQRPSAETDSRPPSKEELDRALVACLLNEPDGCTNFFNRLTQRCLDKVQTLVRQEVSGVPDDRLEDYAQEAVEDMTLRASQGKLAVEKSYTQYLVSCLLNKIREWKSGKKDHEIPFSVKDEERQARRNHTTELFVNTLVAPGKPPVLSAIERELLRRVGEQAGGLPLAMRDVVCRVHAGKAYREIARELKRSYATVKAQFSTGMDALQQAIGNSGILASPRLPKTLTQDLPDLHSPEGIEVLITHLPLNIEAAVGTLHLRVMTLDEVADFIGEPRVTAEALVLHGYWMIRMATGMTFPNQFVPHLPPHPHYSHHEVRFLHW